MGKFSERLVELRTSRSLTQDDIGNLVGKTRMAISGWENGRGFPGEEELITLADYFNVTVDYLLGREGAKKHFFDHHDEESEESARLKSFLGETEALIRAKGNVSEEKMESIKQFMEFVFNRDEREKKRQ
jgi:transcriptional regulator with XRE-family HTH domain